MTAPTGTATNPRGKRKSPIGKRTLQIPDTLESTAIIPHPAVRRPFCQSFTRSIVACVGQRNKWRKNAVHTHFGHPSGNDRVAPRLPLWYLLELSRTSGRDQRDICARRGLCL